MVTIVAAKRPRVLLPPLWGVFETLACRDLCRRVQGRTHRGTPVAGSKDGRPSYHHPDVRSSAADLVQTSAQTRPYPQSPALDQLPFCRRHLPPGRPLSRIHRNTWRLPPSLGPFVGDRRPSVLGPAGRYLLGDQHAPRVHLCRERTTRKNLLT